MADLPTGNVCFYRPGRKRKRIYSAKDVGRIVAYARNDGAPDILLIAYILQSFGLRQIQCLLFKVLDTLNIPFFLGAILLIIKGLSNLLKVVKIITLGKKSRLTFSLIEQLWPSKFTKSLATFLFWVGSTELALGVLTVFITSMANNVALYLLMKGVCETEIAPLRVELQKSVDTGTLYQDISDSYTILKSILEDNI